MNKIINKIWISISNHKLETGVLIGIICAIIFLLFSVRSCTHEMNKVGGFRTIIVESGKEIKLIADDIDSAVEEHYKLKRNEP